MATFWAEFTGKTAVAPGPSLSNFSVSCRENTASSQAPAILWLGKQPLREALNVSDKSIQACKAIAYS